MAKAKKTESKGAKSDKPKTKRAPSPYILFCSEKRPELKASHPDASFGEMGKMLGQLWAQMDEKAKAVSIPNPFAIALAVLCCSRAAPEHPS